MEEMNFKPNIEAAVNWWADAISLPKHDNGEQLPAFLYLMMKDVQVEPSLEQLKKFKEVLAQCIEKELENRRETYVEVDYHPCASLREAGNAIGLSEFNYPWKTSMTVSEELVQVSAGYGAPWETLWSKEMVKEQANGRKRKL